MRIISSVIFVLIILYFSSPPLNSNPQTGKLLPCCNNKNPASYTDSSWSFKCGGEYQQDIVISRNCCLEKWWMYGPYPSANTPCACQGEEGHD